MYEASADNACFQVWSEDRFVDDPESPDVFVIRAIPRSYFREYIQDTPQHVDVIQPPGPRRLRLLA